MNYEDIPLMFQSQLPGRCQLQRVKSDRHTAYQWKDEWTKLYTPKTPTNSSSNNTSISQAFAKAGLALQENEATEIDAIDANEFFKQAPQFANNVHTGDYRISWRLVSNSGQDEGFIRPIIGTKGYPYFSGSSMKGAFRRACKDKQEILKYCGGEIIENGEKCTKPGILRFHGAYPIDTSWTERLVDIIHSQEKKQVKEDSKASANAMISLHQVTLRFGISSTANDEKTDWNRVWEIWDRAVAYGLGSRVSAGYGQLEKVEATSTEVLFPSEQVLVTVSLKGQGIASTLLKEDSSQLSGASEFRPNMFKAALRGHTLRLLGGITNAQTAEYLTNLLWGGFQDKDNPIVGLLGVRFECKSEDLLKEQEYTINTEESKEVKKTPIYDLENGVLRILAMHSQESTANSKLKEVAEGLIKFAMLFGGFGKYWRRIDHCKFYYSNYTKSKPTIGCHWEFTTNYESFYLPINTLENSYNPPKINDVKRFIHNLQQTLRSWAVSQIKKNLPPGTASSWREAWYPYEESKGEGGVQVWGRITADEQSLAIKWFHHAFNGASSIKGTDLAGWLDRKNKLAKTGRIWHRMYPHYQKDENEVLKPMGGYVEFLTVFPDETETTKLFLNFLPTQGFIQVW